MFAISIAMEYEIVKTTIKLIKITVVNLFFINTPVFNRKNILRRLIKEKTRITPSVA